MGFYLSYTLYIEVLRDENKKRLTAGQLSSVFVLCCGIGCFSAVAAIRFFGITSTVIP